MSDLKVRERLENFESNLAPCAARSVNSRGRLKYEDPCPLRTDFQIDRDRILYSNAFRRLKHKTQVFIAPLGDHYITRLTHTLQVSQIARTISRALNLNEDLSESISLGHDLGHTPFGHLGEDVLNELNPNGFRHNEQSLRIVDVLEKNGEGLNLTWEVRDGIVKHSKSYIDIFAEGWEDVGTIEGQVVKISDVIAYINHDTDDAIRAGIISEKQLPQNVIVTLGSNSSNRINMLVSDIVRSNLKILNYSAKRKFILKMSESAINATQELRTFLFEHVYNSHLANKDKSKARNILCFLYEYFYNHTEQLPSEYNAMTDDVHRKVTDYIAGMTDQYALLKWKEIRTGRKTSINQFS